MQNIQDKSEKETTENNIPELFILNKKGIPMGHIAHLSNIRHDKFRLMQSLYKISGQCGLIHEDRSLSNLQQWYFQMI